jgi:recombination protein RecA
VAIPKRDPSTRPELASLVADLRRSRLLVGPQELEHRLPTPLPTGLAPLDRLLGGGLPRGRIVELPGEKTGSTALALSIVVHVSRSGRLVAWVDGADAFDPRGAREAGATLARLLWCRPRDLRAAIRAADALIASGAFPLVVLDLRRETPRLVAQGAWLRLARGAEAHRSCLLVLGEAGAQSFAAATLVPSRAKARFSGQGPGRIFEGVELDCRLERNKLGLVPGEARLAFRAPEHLPALAWDPPPGTLRFGGRR